MTQEKPIRIAFASILKPVNDTRMFGKFATSLSAIDSHKIYVIGRQPVSSVRDSKIQIHQIPITNRLSWTRFLAPCRVFKIALQIKPHLLVITTHELLWAAVALKLIIGCKIIYDVQENYYLNILHTDAFHKAVRAIVANYVRMKEWLTAPFINEYIIAEKGYAAELPFIKKPVVIENKVRRPHPPVSRPIGRKKTRLIFSGTLAPSTGVLTAIEIATGLHAIDPDFTLTIIGYAPVSSLYEKLVSEISRKQFITLVGGNTLVDHDEILQSIQQADAGIIAYPANPSTNSSIPTKLYEYLGYKLPIILMGRPDLMKVCSKFHAAISIDNKNYKQLHDSLQQTDFYNTEPTDVYWEDQEIIVHGLVNRLLTR